MFSRKKKQLRKERLKRRREQDQAATPTDYGILHFATEVPAGTAVIVYCRASGREQRRRGTLARQVKRASLAIADYGNPITTTIREVSPGWELTAEGRPALAKAVALAKQHNAVIVVESIDRLLRHLFYRDNNNLEPTAAEFEQLLELLDGVKVATLCHPNTPRKGTDGKRSIETKRGQSESGNVGGRPRAKRPGYKKRIRQDKRRLAWVLFNGDAWMSVRGIGRKLSIAPQTVHDWIFAK